ncbi:hypothetical protein IHE51_00575 [Candidatus Parvarchaeota archaeon]|uniref:Uncharacterized protein n=1 Tax=Candidatus Acidifodinimicrobium mancum TaxID=2898728 RepID=A0A8T3UVF2_9ARCH|nr:hypothetical protein [Candidatus Acidifodinimicrobium mancum]MBE5728892.1 hypothetical protein [Candidatus Acidifodinimicrobium mancum]MBE5729735.1 hypothetical protein [Candidatus Acidifodinimicrobium mancum]
MIFNKLALYIVVIAGIVIILALCLHESSQIISNKSILPNPILNSYNWAGYAVNISNYTSSTISSSFYVEKCNHSSISPYESYSSWVGFGGVYTHLLIQAGITCFNINGVDSFGVWFENFTKDRSFSPSSINLSIQPGDKILDLVRIINSSFWEFTIKNLNTSESVSREVYFSGILNPTTAEVIIESPLVSFPNGFNSSVIAIVPKFYIYNTSIETCAHEKCFNSSLYKLPSLAKFDLLNRNYALSAENVNNTLYVQYNFITTKAQPSAFVLNCSNVNIAPITLNEFIQIKVYNNLTFYIYQNDRLMQTIQSRNLIYGMKTLYNKFNTSNFITVYTPGNQNYTCSEDILVSP